MVDYTNNRIPPGVTNGIPKFQRVVDKVVKIESLASFCMDNVTVCGFRQEDHDENVTKLKEALSIT